MANGTEKQTIITKATLIPIGYMVTILLAGMWISNSMSKVDFRLQRVEEHIAEFRITANECVSRGQLRQWARMLASGNPELKVPEPLE